MGVSGSGKSTVGAALAQRLKVPFADADDFHPAANIAKMTAASPRRRRPVSVAGGDRCMARRALRDGGVMSCSALKRKYREQLRRHCPEVEFLHLRGRPRSSAGARPVGRGTSCPHRCSPRSSTPSNPWRRRARHHHRCRPEHRLDRRRLRGASRHARNRTGELMTPGTHRAGSRHRAGRTRRLGMAAGAGRVGGHRGDRPADHGHQTASVPCADLRRADRRRRRRGEHR